MVKIRDQYRQRGAAAAAGLPLAGKAVIEDASVGQTGQTVKVSPLFQDRQEVPDCAGPRRRASTSAPTNGLEMRSVAPSSRAWIRSSAVAMSV